MKLTTSTPLVFKYLALPFGIGGRGGVQRFFMLSQNIPFEEDLYTMGDSGTWPTEKNRVVSSGENPAGTLPIIYANNGKVNPLPQHIASSRYLATVYDCTSGDPYQDYLQDMIADEYQAFRSKWVDVAFSDCDKTKESYKKEDLPKQLTKFNCMYKEFKTHDTYLSVSKKTSNPLWGDAAIFGLLRDNIITGLLTEDTLSEYSELSTMFHEYSKIPAISKWCEMKKAENSK